MTYTSDQDGGYIIRLSLGENLIDCLTQFIKEKNLSGGWVNGLGGASSAELGFYDLAAKKYIWKKFDQLLEITSIQGNVAWSNDEPVLHLHGSFSDKDMRGVGGHIKQLVVGGTCELFIQPLKGAKLVRAEDAETGLKLLQL